MKTNSNYDLLKMFLAIMIVIIHSSLLPEILYPWLRIAVPLFFMISSYFFFSKIKDETDQKVRIGKLKQYIFRNLKFYFFWFIVTLPITLEMREYFLNRSFIKGIIILIRDFLFFGTFPASWFIMALIISTAIIFFIADKINLKKVLFFSFIIYVIVTLRSTYSFLFENISIYQKFLRYYELIIKYSYNSFLVALFWTSCGKCFADGIFKWNKKTNFILFIISGFFLYIEWFLLKEHTGFLNKDCYIFLTIFCISIFHFFKDLKPSNLKYSLFIRKLSIITYATHASIIFILKNKFLSDNNLFIFSVTMLVCFTITLIINYLSKIKYFAWLKFAY